MRMTISIYLSRDKFYDARNRMYDMYTPIVAIRAIYVQLNVMCRVSNNAVAITSHGNFA